MKSNKSSKLFGIAVVVGLIYSASNVITPRISAQLINSVVEKSDKLESAIVMLLLASAAQLIFSIIDTWVNDIFLLDQKKNMREDAFKSFIHRSDATQDERSSFGSFINNHIPVLAEQYFKGTIDIIKCFALIIFSSIALFTINWLLAVIILAISIAMVYMPRIVKEPSQKARAIYSKSMNRYNTILNSFLGGINIINGYNYIEKAGLTQSLENENVVDSEKKILNYSRIIYGMAGFLQITKTVVVLILGTYLIQNETMGVGELIAAIQISALIGAPMEVLSYLLHGRSEVKPLLEEYQNITKIQKIKGELIIEEVESINVIDLAYKIDDLQILEKINLKFNKNGNYLITGSSGSGKSTLLRLIGRIGNSDYTGKIKLNEEDIKEINYLSYYGSICNVFQSPYVFHATLKENILLGRNISDTFYKQIINKMNLDYLLERFDNEEIDEQKIEHLSGGEKQRLAIARAMVGEPKVYLLDEVTSSLDIENASEIEKILLDEQAMVIHVSHKLNPELLDQYDRVINMQKYI